MTDDTDMSAEEFWATEATGIPVQIVTSRAEYERLTRPMLERAVARAHVVFTFTQGPAEVGAWLNGQGTMSGVVPRVGRSRVSVSQELSLAD